MKPYQSSSDKENCSPISSNCKIYSLRDPREETIRYIGLTKRELSKRLNEHLTIDCKFHKGNWITSVLKNDIIPVIELLEDNLTLENAKLKEKQYILLYKSLGAKLTNLTNGGEGTSGYKHLNITKEILSAKRKSILNPFYNKKHSQESLCKMSIKQSKENNGFYGKVHTEETKKIIKEKRKNQIIKTGWNHSEETKQKISQINKGRKKTEEEILRISNKLKGRVFSEEHKQKIKNSWINRKLKNTQYATSK